MAYEDMTREELVLELRKRDEVIEEVKAKWHDDVQEFNKRLFKKFINTLPEAVIVYRNDKIIDINEMATKLIKFDDVDRLIKEGLGVAVIVHPDYENEALKRRNKLLSEETFVEPMEQIMITRDGYQIDIEISGFSFDYEGDHYLISILRDIRNRKLFEEMERRVWEKTALLEESKKYNTLKTKLFSIVSHELKTPLNIIYGTVQLLDKLFEGQEMPPVESMGKYLKIMKQSCNRLLKMINNFIDMNRIEVGFFNLNLKNKDIVKIVEDTTLSIVEYSEAKDINVIFDTEIEEKIIACDSEKIERIMLNLLSNSVKFTEPGGNVKVTIYDGEDEVCISVKDTGIGIPIEMQTKIFETFTQVDASLTRRAEGSGLGLSLTKSLVELHGGSIRVNSNYGEGSEFIISLPFRLIEEDDSSIDNVEIACDKMERVNIEFSDIYN